MRSCQRRSLPLSVLAADPRPARRRPFLPPCATRPLPGPPCSPPRPAYIPPQLRHVARGIMASCSSIHLLPHRQLPSIWLLNPPPPSRILNPPQAVLPLGNTPAGGHPQHTPVSRVTGVSAASSGSEARRFSSSVAAAGYPSSSSSAAAVRLHPLGRYRAGGPSGRATPASSATPPSRIVRIQGGGLGTIDTQLSTSQLI